MTAAYLDDYRGKVIQTHLPGLTPKLSNKLFGSDGRLSEFGVKIDLSKAIGVVDADSHADLILIARVRNRFAHNIHINSFSDEPISDFCNKMRYANNFIDKGIPLVGPEGIIRIKADPPYGVDEKGRFKLTAMAHCSEFHNRLNHLSQGEKPKS
ncbi:MltR family transcriptional regulator [Caulobacter sp. S45]|uniref:MltR family transcriptional regulator n=1 Tax=Caulobacter sp. S45 TaxID=1641861 RepID=UPI0015760643|nr:MltR family transcriptional regulator [Caulobacter sp. S45]